MQQTQTLPLQQHIRRWGSSLFTPTPFLMPCSTLHHFDAQHLGCKMEIGVCFLRYCHGMGMDRTHRYIFYLQSRDEHIPMVESKL